MNLDELRAEIDGLDRELIRLLEARMDVSSRIAAYKQAAGKPVLDTAREAEKLAAVHARCRPETADGIRDIFRAVMAASRAYQTRLMEEKSDG